MCMCGYTLEMTFAAAYLRLSLFTHYEQIKIEFPTEKNMRKWEEEIFPNNSGRYF
jgi:hypothetical protein